MDERHLDTGTLEKINRVVRPTDVPDEGMLFDLLWAEPNPDITGFVDEIRMRNCFGPDVVAPFLETHGLDLICRSALTEQGYEYFRGTPMVSLTSHVSDDFSNPGAVMLVDEQVKPSFLLFDAEGTFNLAVCPIPADQISMLALQLMVPKAWLEHRVFDWIIATRGSAQTRNVKNFRTWAKRQADRYAARQGWRGMLQPAESMETMAEAAEVDLAEPTLLEPEGATEVHTSPKSHAEPADDAGAMEVEAPPESHTEPVDDAGATEVQTSPKSHAEPVDDAGGMEVEAPPESHTEPVDDAGATEVQTSPKSHTEPVDDAGSMEVEMPRGSHTEHVKSAGATAVQTAPESCTEQLQGADAAEESAKADV
ncbi:pph-3 [Symbiodinium sp. CCMP2456]|nr:pph-3 [Symbiodinium sp. CCMP2456]